MLRNSLIAGIACFLLLAGGCDALAFLFLPNTVTVTLINQATGTVEAEIFISDQQDIPRVLLLHVDNDIVDRLGERIDVIVVAGGQTSFFRSCDDLQAIVVGDANLNLIGGLGPDASSDVLRDGDFKCGDEIQMIFHSSTNMLDFDVELVVVPGVFGFGSLN